MTDRYTKIVLTLIALFLGLIAAQIGVAPAIAQGGPTRVQICDSANRCALVTADGNLWVEGG